MLFSEGEGMGEVATSRVGVGGRGSITERVYICGFGEKSVIYLEHLYSAT